MKARKSFLFILLAVMFFAGCTTYESTYKKYTKGKISENEALQACAEMAYIDAGRYARKLFRTDGITNPSVAAGVIKKERFYYLIKAEMKRKNSYGVNVHEWVLVQVVTKIDGTNVVIGGEPKILQFDDEPSEATIQHYMNVFFNL